VNSSSAKRRPDCGSVESLIEKNRVMRCWTCEGIERLGGHGIVAGVDILVAVGRKLEQGITIVLEEHVLGRFILQVWLLPV
jgi:hypothetical protein